MSSHDKQPMILNEFQKSVLRTYGEGEFAYLIEEGIEDPFALGDTLLTFFLVELSTSEDCNTVEDAEGRLIMARTDLDVALMAIEQLAEALQEKLDALVPGSENGVS